MPFYKFGPNDIFHNEITTHPEQSFFIYRCNVYKNNQPQVSGAFVGSVPGDVPPGYANLYELNVDRASDQLIYPFITKDGSLTSFNTISTSNFNNDFAYGDIITGEYPLSATISSSWFTEGDPTPLQPKREIQALRTALDFYSPLSPHYAYSSDLGNKETQEMRIVTIPSIFYGSSIKKGSVSVKVYISGTLGCELKDDLKNGELRQQCRSFGCIARDELEGWWTFDDVLADSEWDFGVDTLEDSSGNGYDGVPDSTMGGVPDPIPQVAGKCNEAAFFDGPDGVGGASHMFEITLPSITGSTVGAAGDGFSVSTWLKKSPINNPAFEDVVPVVSGKALPSRYGWEILYPDWAADLVYWQLQDSTGEVLGQP